MIEFFLLATHGVNKIPSQTLRLSKYNYLNNWASEYVYMTKGGVKGESENFRFFPKIEA